jgi:hypothetical protein
VNLSAIPGAVLALVIFAAALLLLGGIIARLGRNASGKLGAAI